VGIALGRQPLSMCASFDANGDGMVSVAELVTAVNNAQRGCPFDVTPTGSAVPTRTFPAGTPTDTGTPTLTPTPAVGPAIVFFGVTSADGTLQEPTPGTIPIFQRPFGLGFTLVVEARPGVNRRPIDGNTFAPGGVPGLQIQATRPLGNGSTAVCDNAEPVFGGVPGIDPPRLEDPASIADPLNDLGCRFIDGGGVTAARTCGDGCVRFDTGELGCAGDPTGGSGISQFCGQITGALEFPDGDTLVTARVQDVTGNPGAPAQLIVRVAP